MNAFCHSSAPTFIDRKRSLLLLPLLFALVACGSKGSANRGNEPDAKAILDDSAYLAICYGGYRHDTRDIQPTLSEIKEDLRILSAMGIRLLRTYNVKYAEAATLLKAISELRKADPGFEMFVMLGAWIDCKNAWTALPPDHTQESEENADEIARAVQLATQYPDIVKIIAVGNEAMVKWAERYYVRPEVILKWVTHLQDLKANGVLPANLWITSSDNFASWGGGDTLYHTPELAALLRAVDFVSIHTYPMHDTHYNPHFWGIRTDEKALNEEEQILRAMRRARDYAIMQYQSVRDYMARIGVEKPVHIGETGWATRSSDYYGPSGTKAVDEYKSALYYRLMREWSNANGLTCFYFEAFDEPWKDREHSDGSENHFGLFNTRAEAKYALWRLVDSGIFEGLSRGGKPIAKTYAGNFDSLWQDVKMPRYADTLTTSQ